MPLQDTTNAVRRGSIYHISWFNRGGVPPCRHFARTLEVAQNRVIKRSIGLWVIPFLIALTTAASLSSPAQAQNRLALVIGNSKYISANAVPNAVNDARR
jgi:hypothetical protein